MSVDKPDDKTQRIWLWILMELMLFVLSSSHQGGAVLTSCFFIHQSCACSLACPGPSASGNNHEVSCDQWYNLSNLQCPFRLVKSWWNALSWVLLLLQGRQWMPSNARTSWLIFLGTPKERRSVPPLQTSRDDRPELFLGVLQLSEGKNGGDNLLYKLVYCFALVSCLCFLFAVIRYLSFI